MENNLRITFRNGETLDLNTAQLDNIGIGFEDFREAILEEMALPGYSTLKINSPRLVEKFGKKIELIEWLR